MSRALVFAGKFGPAFRTREDTRDVFGRGTISVVGGSTYTQAYVQETSADAIERMIGFVEQDYCGEYAGTLADLAPRCEYCGFPASHRATLDFTRYRFVCTTHAETLRAPFPRDYAIEAI